MKNIGDAVSQITDETVSRLNEMTQAIARLNGINMSGFANAAKAAAKQAKSTMAEMKAAQKSAQTTVGSKTGTGFVQGFDPGSMKSDLKQIGNQFAQSIVPGVQKFFSVLKSAASVVKRIASVLRTIISFIKSLAKHVANIVKNLAGKSLQALKFGADFLGLDKIKGVVKSLNNVLKSFGRIAFYRLIRSAIKAVTDRKSVV